MIDKATNFPYPAHFTKHAKQRMSQRNISLEDIWFVTDHGTRIHRAGRIFFFLRKGDIPDKYQSESRYARLEGSAVVVTNDMHTVITVYRDRRKGLLTIKSKQAYRSRPMRATPLKVN